MRHMSTLWVEFELDDPSAATPDGLAPLAVDLHTARRDAIIAGRFGPPSPGTAAAEALGVSRSTVYRWSDAPDHPWTWWDAWRVWRASLPSGWQREPDGTRWRAADQPTRLASAGPDGPWRCLACGESFAPSEGAYPRSCEEHRRGSPLPDDTQDPLPLLEETP